MTRRALLVPGLLLAAALALLLDRWIVTDREAITSLLDGAARRAERGDWQGLRDALAQDVEGWEPDELVARLERTASGFQGWTADVDEVTVDGDLAAARVTVELMHGRWRESGKLGLVRTERGWRIRSVAPDDPRRLR